MNIFRVALPALLLWPLAACEMPSPQAAAEPIGEYPVWGQGFGQQATQPKGAESMLSAGGGAADEGPVPTGGDNAATESGGGGSATPNMPNAMAGEDWSGGDVAFGKQVFLNNCARCHGAEGKGAADVMGVGPVPTLRDPGWHERTSDNQIASSIAHGKNKMPGFMGKLDGKELRGVIAFVRSIKAGGAPAGDPQPTDTAPAADETPPAPAPAKPQAPAGGGY